MAEVLTSRKTSKSEPAQDNVNADLLLDIYSKMLRIRRFEELAFKHYRKGDIGGFCHLYIGQEAVCVGAISALEKGD